MRAVRVPRADCSDLTYPRLGALALWDDPYLIEAPANVTNEPRFLAVGMIGARHWTAVYTYRSDRVRIISVRRARKQEIDYYEGD